MKTGGRMAEGSGRAKGFQGGEEEEQERGCEAREEEERGCEAIVAEQEHAARVLEAMTCSTEGIGIRLQQHIQEHCCAVVHVSTALCCNNTHTS